MSDYVIAGGGEFDVERVCPLEGHTYVIAEAGACGDGDLGKMRQQIAECAEAGADAVKFQWTSNATAMASRRGAALKDGYDLLYRRYLQWDPAWHEVLRADCDSREVDYMCTVYLPMDVEVIAPYVDHFKVSSFEALDWDIHGPIEQLCRQSDQKCMFISTGMCDSEDVELLRFESAPHAALLHCVSAYPAPLESLGLSNIRHFDLDGFSDHSLPSLTFTGCLAVAAGARIIEAHTRLKHTDDLNPDAAHAMQKDQFADYVSRIRVVEQAMGAELAPDNEYFDHQAAMRPYRSAK